MVWKKSKKSRSTSIFPVLTAGNRFLPIQPRIGYQSYTENRCWSVDHTRFRISGHAFVGFLIFITILLLNIAFVVRYYDKMEREYAMFGGGGGLPSRSPNRYSQQSRYSDTVPLRRHSPAIKPRSTSQNSGLRNNANYYQGRYRATGDYR